MFLEDALTLLLDDASALTLFLHLILEDLALVVLNLESGSTTILDETLNRAPMLLREEK